ncbi:MAG: FGGY family carbohydrate kinase [Gemmataceae bacterium]
MSAPLRHVPANAIVTGFDFSTGSVKGLAFNTSGDTLAEVRLPTDLWTEGGVSELNLMQLEGQVRAAMRMMAARLRDLGRLTDWHVIGISATHHTSGRIDADNVQVRRAICWNDQTLATYHADGLKRLGGQERARALTGGPWAIRYSLSHLIKDEAALPLADWQRTRWIIQHGSFVAGVLTGRYDAVSVSAAASTGLMDLRTCQWSDQMLMAISDAKLRTLAGAQLPRIIDQNEPVGPLCDKLAPEPGVRPLVMPTSDDQQAGLAGGGAVDAGQIAVILGNSAVVNASSATLPAATSTLDAMRLNWGPYLWMRCYNNGAQFLDRIVGPNPDWPALEAAARQVPAGSNGVCVLPFVLAEPSRNVNSPRLEWTSEPADIGVKFRASLEALAYLIALGVREHEAAGQAASRVSVSGGIAKSDLMCEILASVLNKPLHRLVSSEGPALGAAAAALAGAESYGRTQAGDREAYAVADAVHQMVRFRDAVEPRGEWRAAYEAGLREFERKLAR